MQDSLQTPLNHPTIFILPAKGLGFYYNQYDIAPYDPGVFDIFIPFSELKDLMAEGSIIRELSR